MSGCICEGNWRGLVKEYEQHFGKVYQNHLGEYYSFYGLVWASDDFYFGMYPLNSSSKSQLLSCVGSIEGHGYTEATDYDT